jgi:hypothetical protein
MESLDIAFWLPIAVAPGLFGGGVCYWKNPGPKD